MISGVNNGNSNLMQLLLSAMRNSSSTTTASGSATGLSKDDVSSIGSTDKSDKNGFLDCLQDNFSKIDSNNDGQLSQDEIGTYCKNNKPMGPPPGMFIENMKSYDAKDSATETKDSVASTEGSEHKGRAHFKEQLQKTFDKLDTNQDGTISKEELDAATANNGIQGAGQTADQGDGNNIADVFSSIFSKLNGSSDSSKMIEQFTKKLTDAYQKQGSVGNLVSSALDLAI